MIYDDFDVIVADRQGEIYPAMAVGRGRERVTGALPAVPPKLLGLLDRLAGQAWQTLSSSEASEAGAALFRWLLPERLETHFRLAWDRAQRAGHGLRLRLALDPPEIAGLPWELLRDPVPDHTFATAANTLLVRFLDQAEAFGALAEPEAQMPLAMLLVLPSAPDLNLAHEQSLVTEATAPLRGALNIHVLDGPVTRDRLAETLLATPYDIIHVSAHGGYVEGQGYLRLNHENGASDWVDAAAFARLCANTRGLKLMVLNACQSGRISREQAFRGLTPQLIRGGVPAVVAMQYVLTDSAAITFAREFYRQLCMGPRAGQVDVAVTHARSLLAALYPGVLAFAAPALYTHTASGSIFHVPDPGDEEVSGTPASEGARLALFMDSLQLSLDFGDDWSCAGRDQLEAWRRTLLWTEQAYTLHIGDPEPAARQAARYGLALTQSRLAALAEALAESGGGEGADSERRLDRESERFPQGACGIMDHEKGRETARKTRKPASARSKPSRQ